MHPFAWLEPLSDGIVKVTLKHWLEQFGALPMGFRGDVLEFGLPKPIGDPNAAATLAQEMFAFCPDIVFQGTETVQASAQEILGASMLLFWWD